MTDEENKWNKIMWGDNSKKVKYLMVSDATVIHDEHWQAPSHFAN